MPAIVTATSRLCCSTKVAAADIAAVALVACNAVEAITAVTIPSIHMAARREQGVTSASIRRLRCTATEAMSGGGFKVGILVVAGTTLELTLWWCKVA